MQNSNLRVLIIFLCSCFLLSSCFEWGMPDPDSVKYDSTNFNMLAKKIIDQNEVWEMDDFTRHFKRINEMHVRLYPEIKGIDDSTNTFLDKLVDSLKINKANLEELRKGLEETRLREFYKSNDSILFIVDGFLSNSWGFFYTNRPFKIDSLPFRFQNHYVRYNSYINENWRKINIGL